ncbi:MAG: hypothetical protein K2Q97_12705 [Burkholderiaceae bacterium]|nr:hypothetical protein [Burkholderiaceae bacterium]
MTLSTVYTMHWDNIPNVILQKQQDVFASLGIPLQQQSANRVPHGTWMNQVIAQSASDAIIIFCDVDAFPLKRSAYDLAVAHAQQGAIFGLSQFSNHKKTTATYAGPMFMAFQKKVWEQLGSPDLKSSPDYDAAEGLSALARARGVPLQLHKPTATLISKFALGNEGVFGIGTFYGDNDFFHLFESREPTYEQLLVAVADDVIAQRPLRFAHYLETALALQQNTSVHKKLRGWRRLFG